MKLFRLKGKPGPNAREMVLASLAAFQAKGKREISLSELLECTKILQSKLGIGYEFSPETSFSIDFFDDLRELSLEGYVLEYVYRYDAFLPKTYTRLTGLGSALGKTLLEHLTEEKRETVYRSVESAMESYGETWRLWARRFETQT